MSSKNQLHRSNQTVYFGDARSMGQIDDHAVNFIITSPPYWNLKNYGASPTQIGQSTYKQYLEDLDAVWDECYRVAAKDSVLIVNVNTRRVQKQFYPIPYDIVNRIRGWQLWDNVMWYVPNALPQPNHYRERLLDNKFEFCLVFTKDGSTNYKFHKPRVPQKYQTADPRQHKQNSRGRCIGNLLRIPAYRPPNVKKLGYHVAAFPEELVAFFLECYTDPGDVVLDPFLGSGTTLKVCRVMEREGLGYENDPDFSSLIKKRIDEYWEVPDWRTLDNLHSSTMETGMSQPRKIQYQGPQEDQNDADPALF